MIPKTAIDPLILTLSWPVLFNSCLFIQQGAVPLAIKICSSLIMMVDMRLCVPQQREHLIICSLVLLTITHHTMQYQWCQVHIQTNKHILTLEEL